MNSNFSIKTYPVKPKKRAWYLVCLCALIFALFSLPSCSRKVDYFSYVTELRSNIFVWENENLFVRAYALEKESPYVSDGIPCEINVRTEVHIVAKGIDECISVFFQADGKEYGGEASYDNVKGEYFYACPVSTAHLNAIDFSIRYGAEEIRLTAQSVCPPEILSAKEILNRVVNADEELFASLTDKYGFSGEIYMRLLYEDAPFYYVGVINRKCEVTAFLVNAVTGRVLAKRTP